MFSDPHEAPRGNALTKILAVYSAVLTTLLAAFTLAGSAAAKVQRFDEVDVHRINVREPDGHSAPHRQALVAVSINSGLRRVLLA